MIAASGYHDEAGGGGGLGFIGPDVLVPLKPFAAICVRVTVYVMFNYVCVLAFIVYVNSDW